MKKAKNLNELLALLDNAFTDSAYIRSGEMLDSCQVHTKALKFHYQSFIMWTENRKN